MSKSWIDDTHAPSTSDVLNLMPGKFESRMRTPSGCTNIWNLLTWREISPQAKRVRRSSLAESSKWRSNSIGSKYEVIAAKQAFSSWVEAESLKHLSAKYCPLMPPPRSTIAAAFSSDGRTLASTHGDHTVKIIDCLTGSCIKVLSGHRRTPWVVRFHPVHHDILASGSLDHEVRLWDANTANCIGSKDFHRPIASIAFHAQGELLAVASGHKLYIWNYNRREEASTPIIVLKTRRSLRAVHFHPHGAPFLLTAEVNDLDSPNTSLTPATTTGYLQYAPPTLLFGTVHSIYHPCAEVGVPWPWLPSFLHGHERPSQPESENIDSQNIQRAEFSPLSERQSLSFVSSQYDNEVMPNYLPADAAEHTNYDNVMAAMDITEERSNLQNSFNIYHGSGLPSSGNHPSEPSGLADNLMLLRGLNSVQHHHVAPSDDSICCEVPILQGWFLGQPHAGSLTAYPESSLASSDVSNGFSQSRDRASRRVCDRHRLHLDPTGPRRSDAILQFNMHGRGPQPRPAGINIEPEAANTVSSDSATELPCTVKLRIWSHDVRKPSSPLDTSMCRLTIPHAVLCSEMGAHFSPCGRFLAACVACVLPHVEGDPGFNSHPHLDATDGGASPTRHPISGHKVIYELRVYSLEAATFGLVLSSRAIRAAHCLTSIQFSPTSEHMLVAYGRRHGSLLRSFITDGKAKMHVYTILEVYRVSNMELVRVLPSVEDEVNVACFHPLAGYGLVYGTKEGKLRMLNFDDRSENCTGPNHIDDMLGVYL